MLAFKGHFNERGVKSDIVWEERAYRVFGTAHVDRRSGMDEDNPGGLEPEASSRSLPHDTCGRARINHGGDGNRCGSQRSGYFEYRSSGRANRDFNIYHRADTLQVRDLYAERGHRSDAEEIRGEGFRLLDPDNALNEEWHVPEASVSIGDGFHLLRVHIRDIVSVNQHELVFGGAQ